MKKQEEENEEEKWEQEEDEEEMKKEEQQQQEEDKKEKEEEQQEGKEQQQEKEVLEVWRWTCSDLLLRCPQAAWLLTENTYTLTGETWIHFIKETRNKSSKMAVHPAPPHLLTPL